MGCYNLEKDILLIEGLRCGDENAFSEIYQLYAASLIRFASYKLYSLEQAEDLIHDIFVYLWTERKRIQIHSSLQSYLYAMSRYRVIDHIRKNVKREEYATELQKITFCAENSLEKNIDAKELDKVIGKAVENLPPRTKKIYQLSRNENKSISEIAKSFNLSDQTVKNQLTTALKVLRASVRLNRVSVIVYYIFSITDTGTCQDFFNIINQMI